MNKILLLTLSCIVILLTDSANAFQTTAFKSRNESQKILETQDRSQRGTPLRSPVRRGLVQNSQPAFRSGAITPLGIDNRQTGVATQVVIVNGRIVLLPALAKAAQLELAQLQQQQREQERQRQREQEQKLQVRHQKLKNESADVQPALPVPKPPVEPLRVKSKFFNAR